MTNNTEIKFSNDKRNIALLLLLSVVILAGLFWVIYFSPSGLDFLGMVIISQLPILNASLNFLSTIFLILWFIAIKNKNEKRHKSFIMSALFTSGLFLISYIIYHFAHGDTKFLNPGSIKYVYFFILISHILLSVITLPLILITLYFIFSNNR